MTLSSIRQTWYSRLISLCVIATFMATMVITPRASYAQGVMGLPQPGTMVNLSPAYVPLMLTGLTVHPENPLLMDFIVSTGNTGMDAQQVKKASDRLIKYFLACLTIPENNQWVNLSPYEKQRIVPEDLGQTVLGQDMLAQDYILKQLTASLIYPEKNLGKNFWDQVYTKARQMYGTTQIPVNTFNKVWILPQYAKVYEHNNTVFVVKSHLKVMLDEDYLAMNKHADINSSNLMASQLKQSQINNLGSQIVRQIVLPAIEQEVNTGKNFSNLRQIYNSMILAVWFKNNLKQALLNQVYTDKSKVNGVNVDDPAIKEKIYKQYLQAYKKGVFNYIKEEVDQKSQEIVPRKYFSGGLVAFDKAMLIPEGPQATERDLAGRSGEYFEVDGSTKGASRLNDRAMTVGQLTFDLGNFQSEEIAFSKTEDGIKFTNKQGNDLFLRVKESGGIGSVFELGNTAYVVKDNNEPIILSDINLLGNQDVLDFFGVNIESIDPKNFHFALPLDNPNLRKQTEPFPANQILHSDLRAQQPSDNVVNHARTVVQENFQQTQADVNIYELLHNAVILGLYGNWKDYYLVQDLLNKLVKDDLFKDQHSLILSLADYIFVSYVGVDWKRWQQESQKIRSQADLSKEEPKSRIKTLFELPVEPTRLPVTDPQNWEVVNVKALSDKDLNYIPESADDPVFQLGEKAIQEGQVVSVPFSGGSATTVKKIMGAHKMVHPALKVMVEKNGQVQPEPQWISIIQARIGMLLGQNLKSKIAVVTSVAGTIEGESDQSIRKLLEQHYPQQVSDGQIQIAMQRAGLVLDTQGYPLRFQDGHVATVAENHLWAFMAVLLNKNLMLDILEHSSGILSAGNGDNVLNYVRAGMIGAILEARKTDSPIGTLAVTTLSAGDKKGGIAVESTYHNRVTGETITQKELREISEFATSDAKATGFSAVDFSKEKGTDIYKRMEENHLFIEDLFDGKNVAFNVAFYAVDGRLFISRIFGLNEQDPTLLNKLRNINDTKWVDTILSFAAQVPTTYRPTKSVPGEDGINKVEGFMYEQAVQDFLVNAMGLLAQENLPKPRVEVQLAHREDIFLPYKGTDQQVINRDGTVNQEAKPTYDLIANQERYEGARAEGHPIVLGPGETVKEIIPVKTLQEIIDATKAPSGNIPGDHAMTTLPQNVQSTIESWSAEHHWDATVVKNVQDWYASNAVNQEQRDALIRIVEEGKADKIKAGFSSKLGVLQPGTAGTRAEMENLAEDKIGPNYFSTTTVMQYTSSFVNWDKSTGQTGPAFITKEVRENSDTFGDIAARILLAQGISVVRIDRPVSTPFASFLAKWLAKSKYGKPAFGYQISANHNKFADNGIKFMGPDGQQFMPDVMNPIAAGIPSLSAVAPMPNIDLATHPDYHVLTDKEFNQALNAYFDEIDSTLTPEFKDLIQVLIEKGKRFVFTPLNGASGEETILYLKRFGLEEGVNYLIPPQEMLAPTDLPPEVYAQKKLQSSDPANDQVVQGAQQYAVDNNIDTVFARDPDGDRLVLSMSIDGKWKKLDGNQNAVVMAHDRFSHSQDLDKTKMLFMRSHATTTLLDKIASSFGIKSIVVPVGFKYFGAKVIQAFGGIVGRNYFGAEESYGTSNGHINEKDGLSGLANMLVIIARLEQEQKGRNIFDYLNDIYMKFGFPGDKTVNIQLPGTTKPVQDKARENVIASLKDVRVGGTFAGYEIVSFKDQVDIEGIGQFHDGYDLILKDAESGKQFRLLFRASGTEPIFKAYFSWQKPITSNSIDELKQIISDSDAFVGKVSINLNAAFTEMAGDKAMLLNVSDVPDEDWGAPAEAYDQEQISSNPLGNRHDFRAQPARGDEAAFAEPGGIDLNSRNLNMESSGQKVNITFDRAMIAQFKRGDFSGVRIQILDVVPVNLMPLLGLKEDEELGQLAKV